MSSEKIDAYIAKAQPFAQPILEHLRGLTCKAVPEAEESLRWGAPFFILEGRQLCGMAAFKAHCVFIIKGEGGGGAMGDLGRITDIADLPHDDELVSAIREKASRIRSGEDASDAKRKAAKPREEIPMPDDFSAAIAAVEGAQSVWGAFTIAQRNDYLDWITSAKRADTRIRRVRTAAEWIGEGKRRNWKYENC